MSSPPDADEWEEETFSQEPVVLVRNSLPEDEKLDREMAEFCQNLLAELQ